jgi:putative ABC transport system ATP-binding protein
VFNRNANGVRAHAVGVKQADVSNGDLKDKMLELKNAYKTFYAGTANEVRALRGVDLHIAEGEFVIVIGTNGSGKSTLLNAVAGTFFLDEGQITLAEQDVTRWPEHRRAKLIGRVFQNPFHGTAPSLTILENLVLALRRGQSRGLSWAIPKEARDQLRERVRLMGLNLEDRLDTPIGSLSGGQRQSLTLLMATLVKPKLLLLDEHTAALDPKSGDQVIRLTEQIVKQDRLTTMMVTHSMQQAAHLGDRLVMMSGGQIVCDISGDEKKHLRPEDLLARFEEIRRSDLLDESAAEMLAEMYV